MPESRRSNLHQTEWRLVRESPLVGRTEVPLESEERALRLARSWKGKKSQATQETAYVERRQVTEWERIDV